VSDEADRPGGVGIAIIDALALKFGLKRAVKEGKNAEHWHYERVGI
jgi:hypothetical protein